MQNRKDAQIELIDKFKNYLVKFDSNYFEPEKKKKKKKKTHYFIPQLIVNALGLIF